MTNPASRASRNFAADYIGGKPEAAWFLPSRVENLSGLVAARETSWVPLTRDEARELVDFNVEAGNHAGGRLVEALAQPGALAVVTGQQPNLLASPLYILYKALTACAVARELQAALGRSVIPIFWVASDDHDFQELRDCWIPAPDGSMHNLGLLVSRGAGIAPGSAAFQWDLTASAPRVLSALTHLMPARPDWLPQTCRGTFEESFCGLLARFLCDNPIVLLAPRLSFMRRRQSRTLERELLDPGPAFGALQARAAQLAARGYEASIHRDPDVLNAFYLRDGIRGRLVRVGADVRCENPSDGGTLCHFTRDELMRELRDRPERFSPNVVTRPVVQDAALPVLAYVGGPNELAYMAQLGPVYELHGVAPSIAIPRKSALVLDRRTRDGLRCIGIDVTAIREIAPAVTGAELASRATSLLDAHLRTALLPHDSELADLEADARVLESDLQQRIASLRSRGAAQHPHLQRGIDKTERTLRLGVERFRRRLVRQLAQRDTPAWQTYSRARNMLTPFGQPQERILSPIAFLADRTPQSLAAELQARLNLTDPHPEIVELD